MTITTAIDRIDLEDTARLAEPQSEQQANPQPGSQSGSQPDPRAGSAPQLAEGENARAFAITSFVLGIASIVSGWTFVAPLTGLILGIVALRRNTSERTLALWGVWLNGVMLALTAIAVFVLLALLGAGIIALPILAA